MMVIVSIHYHSNQKWTLMKYLHAGSYIYIYTSKNSQILHDFLCIPSGNAPSSRPGRSGNSSSTVPSSNISKGGGSGATSGGLLWLPWVYCWYCWWFRNPVNSPVEVVYHIIYRGLMTLPGGCWGFLPSTVGSGGFSSHPTNKYQKTYYDAVAGSFTICWICWLYCIGSESLQWPSESWFPPGSTNPCMIVGMEVFETGISNRNIYSCHPKQLDSPRVRF